MRTSVLAVATVLIVSACTSSPPHADLGTLQKQVMEAERAFAQAMAKRDYAGFTSFLSDEAIFFSGETPVRGKQAVADEWKSYFDSATPPFSWEPDRVEVLESGSLALSTGPVHDPAGKVIGRFNSIWRREPSGQWRVIFDKGSPVCPAPSAN